MSLSKHSILSVFRATLVGCSALSLVSCAMQNTQKNYVDEVSASYKSPLASLNPNKKLHPAVAQAIGLMRDKKYSEASQFLNQALQNDPQSVSLHLLNALVYEKLAELGDSSRLDLAGVGYQNALNVDPNNVFAMTQLAKIKFKNKQYDQAQELYANALLIKKNDVTLLQELAASSYYAYDAKTALAAIDQAIKLEPNNPLALRSAAMIHAALGDIELARKYESQYQKLAANDPDTARLASRLNDWEFLYNSGRIKLAAATPSGGSSSSSSGSSAGSAGGSSSSSGSSGSASGSASSSDSSSASGSSSSGSDLPDQALSGPPASGSDPIDDSSDNSDSHSDPDNAINALSAPLSTDATSGSTPSTASQKDEQIIIDCYLLSITESASTQKGQNLLETLKVTLNPGSWNKTISSAKGSALRPLRGQGGIEASGSTVGVTTVDNGLTGINAPATVGGAATGVGPSLNYSVPGNMNVSTFSTGINWAGLVYSLNIANAVEERTEVIGRPTLHAFLNKQAVFFSGQELVTGLSGTNGGSLVRYPLGTTLFVTVSDIQEDAVTLSISIEGSLNAAPGLNLQNDTLTVQKTRVDTTAKMLLGETLMLGGIFEQIKIDSNNGVPGVKDIPIAQYFFSNEQTLNERSSIVVLLTPRSTDAVKIAVSRAMSRKNGDKVTELSTRHPDWYQTSPNLAKIFNYIGMNPVVYQEFRSSDVLPPHWGWDLDFDYKLDQILAFAYY